jgi:hypothetical protein
MAKHKSPQELMAARNPLERKPVVPVDIYTQPLQAVAEEPMVSHEPTHSVSNQEPGTSKALAPQTTTPNIDGLLRKYSTYLSPSQIKAIKLRAVEHDVYDFAIVQEAIDEYFQKHPL